MSSKVILMIPKNQESSKIQGFKNQDSSFKNQDSRIIKIKIQDSRFKKQGKTQSR